MKLLITCRKKKDSLLYRGKAPAGSIGRGNYSGEWRIEGSFKSKSCMGYNDLSSLAIQAKSSLLFPKIAISQGWMNDRRSIDVFVYVLIRRSFFLQGHNLAHSFSIGRVLHLSLSVVIWIKMNFKVTFCSLKFPIFIIITH